MERECRSRCGEVKRKSKGPSRAKDGIKARRLVAATSDDDRAPSVSGNACDGPATPSAAERPFLRQWHTAEHRDMHDEMKGIPSA